MHHVPWIVFFQPPDVIIYFNSPSIYGSGYKGSKKYGFKIPTLQDPAKPPGNPPEMDSVRRAK